MRRQLFVIICCSITFGAGWFANELVSKKEIHQSHQGDLYGKNRFNGLTVGELLDVFGQPSGKLMANSFNQDVWFYSGITLMLDAREIDGKDPLGNRKRLVSRILIPQSCDPDVVSKMYEAHSNTRIVKKEINILGLNRDGSDTIQ